MLIEDFVTLTIRKQKNIALIAHDSKKKVILKDYAHAGLAGWYAE